MWYVIRRHDGDFAIINRPPRGRALYQSQSKRSAEMFMEIQQQNIGHMRRYVRTVATIAGATFLAFMAVSDLLGSVGGW